MDDDAGDEQEPLPIGRWLPTSSHDVYMVNTPKENNEEERKDAAKGCSLEKQSKRRRKRHSKSRLGRSSDHINPAIEQGEPADDKHGIEPSSDHGNTENQTEHPTPAKITIRMTSHRTGTRSNRIPIKGLLPLRGV